MTAPTAGDVPAWAIRLEAKLDRLADDLERLNVETMNMRERLYGNGKPGVISEVAEARKMAQEAIGAIASRDRLLGALGGGLLTLVLGLLWSIFTGQVSLTFKP